jgi:hypothetical protein
MDEATYKLWWTLHRRATTGGSLSPEERTRYEEGLKELHAEEQFVVDIAALREAKQRVEAMTAECEQLRAQRLALAAEIETLEAALSERTRQALNAKD